MAPLHSHAYIVIMAGGSGTRLWPLSRRAQPKQFQACISVKTLLQETFFRAIRVVAPAHIFVSTTAAYQAQVLAQLPELPEGNLIVEPDARNTAPAIAWCAATIARADPQALVATIASDHAIENPEELSATLTAAFATVAAYPDKLVTVGINPSRPDTGLGYIKMGREFTTLSGKRVFQVDAFKEKPDLATAERYLTNWEYLWNAGYFIFAAKNFTQWTRAYVPRLHQSIVEIMEQERRGTLDAKTLKALYAQTPPLPIDTAIVEKLAPDQCLVIPSALKWSDVGGWENLYGFLREQDGNHMVIRGQHLGLESRATLVYGRDKLIVTVGVENLVIVETEEVILVAKRQDLSRNIKRLLETMQQTDDEQYL